MEHCPEHANLHDNMAKLVVSVSLLQKDIEYLRRDQETILARFGQHVNDADTPNGWHDRVRRVEEQTKVCTAQRQMDNITGRWFMVGSGVMGGLIGAGIPEAVQRIARMVGI